LMRTFQIFMDYWFEAVVLPDISVNWVFFVYISTTQPNINLIS
jgi:hypothetical protein